ncbi:MAG: penicillin-binding transpeptidase domain-containing protein [Subdoligranulum sp.]
MASTSMPEFDPDDIAASIRADDTSLINRSLSAFSAGSVFKVVLARAAYAQGLDWFTYDCTGSIQTAGETFRCALGRAHGTVNLRGALEQSCNCYFIALGQLLGGQAILNAAQSFGLGNPALLAPGLKSAAGELPSAADLQNAGSLASFSFGQGGLTVTPLQVTAMFNAIASDGVYHSPCIVSGTIGGTQKVPAAESHPQLACASAVARVLQSMLATVVRSGIGGDAQPRTGTAAGKTGTAQTGQFDADGRELLHYWFAGFYPADAPRYTITVLQDSQQKPQTSSATLFAQVADALAVLDAAITEKPAENS